MKKIKITEKEAKSMYYSGIESLKLIAEINFPELFKKELEWEDFGEIKGYYINSSSEFSSHLSHETDDTDKNTYPTKAEAERELALIQLRQWRDKANGEKLEEWCDWENLSQERWAIKPFKNSWLKDISISYRDELTFKTEVILDKFIEQHKTLIDKAFNL